MTAGHIADGISQFRIDFDGLRLQDMELLAEGSSSDFVRVRPTRYVGFPIGLISLQEYQRKLVWEPEFETFKKPCLKFANLNVQGVLPKSGILRVESLNLMFELRADDRGFVLHDLIFMLQDCKTGVVEFRIVWKPGYVPDTLSSGGNLTVLFPREVSLAFAITDPREKFAEPFTNRMLPEFHASEMRSNVA